MEVHIYIDKPITASSKDGLKKFYFKKYEDVFNKLQEDKTKGIPRKLDEDKFIFLFDSDKVVVTPATSVATLIKFFELATPSLKQYKYKEIKLSKPVVIRHVIEKWKPKAEIKLKQGELWQSLSHNGIYLGEPYELIKVPLIVDGKKVKLNAEDEEILALYGKKIAQESNNPDTVQYTKDLVFVQNFVKTSQKYLSEETFKTLKNNIPKNTSDIKKFNDMFKGMKDYFLSLKKDESKEEKLRKKTMTKDLERTYKYIMVDGRKEEIGNFKVEPPGLLLGRGDNPRRGCIKGRVRSSDVTLNISKGSKIPKPNDGGEWGKIIHDNTVQWIASWDAYCTDKKGAKKYAYPSATAQIKGESDRKKYEKARKLGTMIDTVVDDYMEKMRDTRSAKNSQIGTIVYLVDNHAFRIGHEKSKDDTDTVGVSTLKVSNVDPQADGKTVIFDFLGKDSIRFFAPIEMNPDAYKNMVRFRKGKKPSDLLFDNVDADDINEYLRGFMKGLTAKVFRTFRASTKYYELLNDIPKKLDANEKIKLEKDANRGVAKLCNHQRKASAKTKVGIDKKREELKGFERDLKKIKDKKSKEYTKLKTKIDKLKDTIDEREKNLDVACITSKTNYIDPRIAIAWAKYNEIPLTKLYPKKLLEKFTWAVDTTDEDWDYFKSPVLLVDSDSPAVIKKKGSATKRGKSKSKGTSTSKSKRSTSTKKTPVKKSKAKMTKTPKIKVPLVISEEEEGESDESEIKIATPRVQKIQKVEDKGYVKVYEKYRENLSMMLGNGRKGLIEDIKRGENRQFFVGFGNAKADIGDETFNITEFPRTKLDKVLSYLNKGTYNYEIIKDKKSKNDNSLVIIDEGETKKKSTSTGKSKGKGGGVVIILNYTAKSHALVDQSKSLFKIRNEILAITRRSDKVSGYSKSLTYDGKKIGGFFYPKDKIDDIKRLLVDNSIEYTVVDKEDTLSKTEKKKEDKKVSPLLRGASPDKEDIKKKKDVEKKKKGKLERVIIGLNYITKANRAKSAATSKSHIIIGPYDVLSPIKDDIIHITRTKNVTGYNRSLDYRGNSYPGYFFAKEKLKQITSLLKFKDIDFIEDNLSVDENDADSNEVDQESETPVTKLDKNERGMMTPLKYEKKKNITHVEKNNRNYDDGAIHIVYLKTHVAAIGKGASINADQLIKEGFRKTSLKLADKIYVGYVVPLEQGHKIKESLLSFVVHNK
jgi:DNA topoisomerase-1